MKKLFAGKLLATIILSLAAVAAMAMPRPSDIENALAARDYNSAKSMTQEVLRERPDSAKAHLFNAYVLLKADNNRGAAEAELKTARMLDRDHKVQNSALFGRTVVELERAAPVQRAYPKPSYGAPSTTYVQTPVGDSALVKVLKFMFWASIIGVILYVLYKMFNSGSRAGRAVVTTRSWAETPVQPLVSETYERPYLNHGRRYDAPAHPIYAAPAPVAPVTVVNNGGSHSDGLLTGMLLNEAMHSHSHHDHGHSHRDTYVEREYVPAAPAYQPSYPSDTTDYETKRSSYSSGSDDDWKSSSSSSSSYSSGSDSWGSSSSSSSYDSGGSYDSGSSSSSWD